LSRLATCIVLICAGACAPTKPAVRIFDMKPMTILGDPDGDPALAGAEVAFEVALKRYDAGDRTGALKYYDAVWKRWPGDAAAPLALYNAGLILEELHDFPAALSRYLTVIDAFAETDEAYDAHFRAAWCWEKLRRPDKSAELAGAVLEHPRLTPEDRLDATIRLGVARFKMGQRDAAEALITHALSPIGLARGLGELDGNSVAAQGQFMLGEIWRERYGEVRLALPMERMRRDLERKCTLLIRAQYSYLRAIRMGDRHWATASAYGIGRLYDEFTDEVIGAEVPPEFSAEERAVYYCELKKYLDILTRKAILVYSRNADLAERLGIENEWVDKGQERLQVLQERYLDEYDLCRENVERAIEEEQAAEGDAEAGPEADAEPGDGTAPDAAPEPEEAPDPESGPRPEESPPEEPEPERERDAGDGPEPVEV